MQRNASAAQARKVRTAQVAVESLDAVGVYAPLTTSGLIDVDGFTVSCYAVFAQ